jgi:hypothetical protein
MSTLANITLAGEADIRQRLNSDGVRALGLAAPLLSAVWTQAKPFADELKLMFRTTQWYAPIAGMLIPVPDGIVPGLSLLDGSPAATGTGAAALLRIHPQARLRLERLFAASLQPAGLTPPDRSLRAVPSVILINNIAMAVPLAQHMSAGELGLPPGDVSFHDERGLIIDPFAFAAAVAALLGAQPVLAAPMPAGATAGTPAVIAWLAAAGQFFHATDLHGRPWNDPGAGKGIGLFTGPANARVPAGRVSDGTVLAWTGGAVLAAESDPGDATRPRAATTPRFGWAAVGTMDTAPLSWPAAGAAVPTRDTLRVAAVDLPFHLLGNRSTSARDGVGRADDLTVAEQMPLVRDGSPVALLADGHDCLAWWRQVILGLQGGNPAGAFNSGPILAVTVAFDDERFALPLTPGPAGRWPVAPAAVPLGASVGQVLNTMSAMRGATTAQWIAGNNDVLATLPPGLPNGIFVRLYPLRVLLGTSPNEQNLLVRNDGNGDFIAGGTAAIVLRDPFNTNGGPRPAPAKLRADASLTWLSANTGAVEVHMIGNLSWPVNGEVAAPPAAGLNFLGTGIFKSQARAPLIGAPSAGSYNIGAVIDDPVKYLQDLARQLTTDRNPREAPRLPTMARTESLLAIQSLNNVADPFSGVLTGGWLTREADRHTYRAANPGGASESEVHAPGIAATSQLGFDMWVAALHRCRPVVPTADVAAFPGFPNNWVLLQTGAQSVPPNPLPAPSTFAGALLQTVPGFVETPEMALIPDDDVPAVENWITNQLGNWLGTPNDPEIHRQLVREVRSSKYGRREAQWALRRAIRHARELIYIETPLLAHTAHGAGGPPDPNAAADLINELANRLTIERGLRVVILVPRNIPFPHAFDPWSMFFYAARNQIAQTLALAARNIEGLPRVVIGHPMGMPGRPLVIRTTTVIVDDVWASVGTSSLSRRGLTFDGANDVVLVDRALDRGVGAGLRNFRKRLMAMHLGANPNGLAPASPDPLFVELHQGASAHRLFATILTQKTGGRIISLWPGPDPMAPGAVLPHPPEVADPDGRAGASSMITIAGALAGNGRV